MHCELFTVASLLGETGTLRGLSGPRRTMHVGSVEAWVPRRTDSSLASAKSTPSQGTRLKQREPLGSPNTIEITRATMTSEARGTRLKQQEALGRPNTRHH